MGTDHERPAISKAATRFDRVATEAVVRRVESLWRQGGRPEPSRLLAEAGLTAPAQVAAVLAADQWQRWRAGQRVPAEDYLARHPAVAGDPPAALLLVYGEFLVREELGEAPALDDYLRRFPQYADALRLQLEFHRAVSSGSAGPTALNPDAPTVVRDEPGRGAGAAPAVPGYELHGRLGHGGMGDVWLGRDARLGRDVAVKVLKDELSGRPNLVRRFIEEAQVASQLAHPAIPPVHELGALPDGRPFFAMKVVKGHTLADLLDARRDPAEDLPRFVGIFEQVCQAVAFAHSKKVIHRDLKPANVMVGAFGEVQVMDWGLAKVQTRAPAAEELPARESVVETVRSSDVEDATQAGSVLGTYAYMPPEQARGEVWWLDERCDVFGLGAILCEILTGQPPYGGTLEQTRVQARQGQVARALERLAACGADGELVELARQCLSPRAEGRPANAGAVAEALTAYLAAVQERLRLAEVERAAAQARAAEERKRRRVALALAAAVLALVAVGAGGGLWVQHQAAERREEQARRDAERRQTVESALEKAAALRQQARRGEARAVLDQARQVLGDAGPADLRRRLEEADAELVLVNSLDVIRQHRATWVEGHLDTRTPALGYAAAFKEAGLGEPGDDEGAVAQRVRASRVAGPLIAALDDWAAVAQDLVTAAWLLGVARRADPDPWRDRFRDPAVRGDRQALRALADDALRDGGARLDGLSPQGLAALGALLGGGAEAVPLLRAAQRRHPDDFWLSLLLANAFRNVRQDEEAVAYYRIAVALRPDSGVANYNLGIVLRERHDVDGALAAFRRAAEFGPEDASAHSGLGSTLQDNKDLDGAVAEFRRAIDLDPRNAKIHNNLGLALEAKRDLDGAIAAYRKALELDPQLAQAHGNLGNALRAKGDLDGAVAACRRAIELDAKLPGAYSNLGNALLARKDRDGAIAAYRRAIELDPKDAKAHSNLGIALYNKGEVEGAIAAFRQAISLDPKFALAHGALSEALLLQGRFAEAREATRRCLELLPEGEPLRRFASQQLRECERLAALDEKLPAVLAGRAEAAGAAELFDLAHFCWHHKHWHLAAARLYADAFAADSPPPADPRLQQLYDAACSAARAADGQGQDARPLPDKERRMLRRQALAWLRDDLAAYRKLAERDAAAGKQLVRERMQHWQRDADLASVRDPQALGQLPEDERRQWHQLWEEVATLLKKVEQKP